MAFLLRDIIDLEFLLNLDDQEADSGQASLHARDREIFGQIHGPQAGEAHLVREWLSLRKLLFYHETSQGEILPGDLFASLMGWTARGLFAGGVLVGLTTAYSFLAYHGTRPVNVTVFIVLFVLLQALLSVTAMGILARQALGGRGRRTGVFQALASGLFFKRLERLYARAADLPGGASLTRVQGMAGLLAQVRRHHRGILFWPFFTLSSLLALGFSCGALGGTLFRVAVTDLAFGWQSTLVTSAATVHDLVSWIALPWAWALPEALPSPEQIEGSRILLKEGIAGLATGHLTAWWPFLCMGLVTYGVLLRLAVAGLAFRAQASALARLDTDQPRLRRLLVRMQSPHLETRTRNREVSVAENRPRPPRPDQPPRAEIMAAEGSPEGPPDSGQAPGCGPQPQVAPGSSLCQVLVSEQACPGPLPAALTAGIKEQLGLEVRKTVPLAFDLDRDRAGLEALARTDAAVVVFVQEVWQPPIRGLLHYYSQVKTAIFPDTPVWILLVQGLDQEMPGVPAEEMNYQVWKKAVAQLGVPGLVLERILP